jgi:hypothetical protein
VVRLRVGQAVVHNEFLDKPVLLQIHAVKDNLRDQFERDIGRAGLRQRMVAFQQQVRDIYRRWPGCHSCKSPCEFYSELNAPDSPSYEAFQTFLASLVVAAPPTVLDVWRRTREQLREGLRKRYGGADPAPGVLQCHVTELAHLALKEWHTYYRGGRGGFASYLKLEELLLGALPLLMEDGPLDAAAATGIVAFTEELRSRVTIEPRRAEPGCRECRRRCWYGFLVQRDLAPKSRALAERLKSAAAQPGFVNNFDRLAALVGEFARDVTPFPVAGRHIHHLAYCYLVNSGATRPWVLRGFQAAGSK